MPKLESVVSVVPIERVSKETAEFWSENFNDVIWEKNLRNSQEEKVSTSTFADIFYSKFKSLLDLNGEKLRFILSSLAKSKSDVSKQDFFRAFHSGIQTGFVNYMVSIDKSVDGSGTQATD